MTITELPEASELMSFQTTSASGSNLTDDHARFDTQREHVVGDPTSDTAIRHSRLQEPSAVSDSTSPPAKVVSRNQPTAAGGDPNSDSGQGFCDTQSSTAAVGSTSTGGHFRNATQTTRAPGGFLRDPVLGVLSDVLDDFEKVRIANENRVRQMTRTEADSDGEERGFGLTPDHPEVAKLILTVKAMDAAEHDAILNLQRALRKHPLAPFQKRYRGLGEKQFARLLATIGDPYWNDLHDRPRTVSELWAYCGFDVRGGAAPKRQRGQQSNWSEDARKRTWVISASLLKGGRMLDDKRGPQDPVADYYRTVYDNARMKYASSLHPADCVRCGPAGKPALAGSPRSDAHIHAMALRIVSKTLLKDMWSTARDLHQEGNIQ